MATIEERKLVREAIMETGAYMSLQQRTPCPICGPDRKKHNDPSMSLTAKENDTYLYYCHHCLANGSVQLNLDGNEMSAAPDNVRQLHEPKPLSPVLDEYAFVDDDQLAWFASRGISEKTCEEFCVVSGMVYIPRRESKVRCVGFPYVNLDGTTAIKWRDGKKNFSQTGRAASLWRLSEFTGGDLIITEGEMDAMSFGEAGIFATSVPNGAPSSAVTNATKKFEYLWDAKAAIDMADRVIIAGDQDEPGEVLLEEIARRIGKAKCWRLSFPADCKDANEVLTEYGPEALQQLVSDATPWPIGGLRDARDYREDVLSIFRDGMNKGINVDVGRLKEYHRPSPGTFTIVTGTPGSGKSTWLNWLSYILATQEGWNCAVFAGETSSQVHILQLASLYQKKSFKDDVRMSEEELLEGMAFVQEKYIFIDESETSIDSILERAHAAVLRRGVRMLVIDPFNFVTLDRPSEGDNGQHGINQMLVRLKGFAVEHDVAVYLVAHPKKMHREAGGDIPIPTGYDISGSAHFFNVADSGITISREVGDETLNEGEARTSLSRVTNWKTRFDWLGSIGSCNLAYNPEDSSFFTAPEWGSCDSDYDFSFKGN